MDVGVTFSDLEIGGAQVDYQAKILGIQGRDAEIAEQDSRFNEENNPEDGATIGGTQRLVALTCCLRSIRRSTLFSGFCARMNPAMTTRSTPSAITV